MLTQSSSDTFSVAELDESVVEAQEFAAAADVRDVSEVSPAPILLFWLEGAHTHASERFLQKDSFDRFFRSVTSLPIHANALGRVDPTQTNCLLHNDLEAKVDFENDGVTIDDSNERRVVFVGCFEQHDVTYVGLLWESISQDKLWYL